MFLLNKVKKVIGDEWGELIYPYLSPDYFNKLLKFLNIQYSLKSIYPLKKDVFNCFKKCEYKNLKVVIIGNEPYDNYRSNGLAFANNEKLGNKISPSLHQIEQNITYNLKNGLYFMDYSLEQWAEQGVLLLNKSLTSKHKSPMSYFKYWKRFTDAVIKSISDNNTGIIFLIWGNSIEIDSNLINKNVHYVFKCENPLKSYIKSKDWDCNHFNKVNEIIKEANGKEFCIKW